MNKVLKERIEEVARKLDWDWAHKFTGSKSMETVLAETLSTLPEFNAHVSPWVECKDRMPKESDRIWVVAKFKDYPRQVYPARYHNGTCYFIVDWTNEGDVLPMDQVECWSIRKNPALPPAPESELVRRVRLNLVEEDFLEPERVEQICQIVTTREKELKLSK